MLLIFVALFLKVTAITADPLLVTLPNGAGQVQGFKLNKFLAWRGIPYAQPPTGKFRWRPPQPVLPWHPAILSTTEYKPNCLQPGPPCWYSIKKVHESSEDCLYVDVYVPDVVSPSDGKTTTTTSLADTKTPKAVMVWIHGGDYQYGGSNDAETEHPPPYPRLANVIYVSVNYRLSVFGYLGSEHLRSRDVTTPKSTGNYGAQDQRAAIKWTKDNIAAFGGDPTRITIFGESAGAGSVTNQLVMPRSFGLFNGAITESGGFSQWVAKEMPRAEDNYAWVMDNLGLKPTEVDRLVGLPAHEILNAAQYYMPGCPWPDTMVQSQFAPTIDGVELMDQPSVLLASGQVAPDVSVIFGSNRDEGTMFVSDNNYTHRQGHYSGANLPKDINENQFYDFTYGSWGAIVGRMMESEFVYPLKCKRVELEYELCPIGTYNTWWWAATRACGDFMMTCTARRAARQFTSFGHDAYNYYFSHTPVFSVNTYPTAPWGAFHGSEVPFVWGANFEMTGPGELALSKTMVRYWSNFAKNSNPNKNDPAFGPASKLPHWNKLKTKESDDIVRLATGKWEPYNFNSFEYANVSTIEGLRRIECDFWDKVNGYVVDPIPFKKNVKNEKENENENKNKNTNNTLHTRRYQKTTTNIMTSMEWTILQPLMPTPRSLFGMVTVGTGSHIYTVGGLTADATGTDKIKNNVHIDSDVVEIFNVNQNKWHQGPSLNQPRSGLGVVAVVDPSDATQQTGRIFAIGGMYGKQDETDFYALPYVEMLDVKNHPNSHPNSHPSSTDAKWIKLPDLPANRTEMAVVYVQGRIYVIGGAGATLSSATESMWSMNVLNKDQSSMLSSTEQTKEKWRKEAPLPTLRAALTAEVIDNQIVVVGGMRGFLASQLDPDPMRTVDVYDPAKRKWKLVQDEKSFTPLHLPEGRHSPASVVVPSNAIYSTTTSDTSMDESNMLIVGGGYGTTGDMSTVLGLVAGKDGKWIGLPSMNVKRMGLRMAYSASSGCMYAMGGMTLDSNHHDVVGSSSPITGVVEELCMRPDSKMEL